MAGFDCDVLIIGSGFGVSVAALRAAEKGYRVGVMESGKRWSDEDVPKSQWHLPEFLWSPGADLYGLQRVEYLDDLLVLSGAGVGGGSHVYANTLYVPPKEFFDAPEWSSIIDWADELAPHIDQATRMLGVTRYPYMPTDVDRVMQSVAIEMGRGETFNQAPVGVYFGSPGVEVDDPHLGGVGPRRSGCVSCGKDARPTLGSGYQRVRPVMPHRPKEGTTMTELASDDTLTIDDAGAIPNGGVLPYYLRDRKLRVSIARVDDRLYVFDDLCTCTNESCPLSGGLLTGTTIMCQCHGSKFDIATGAVIDGPATTPLAVHEVREVDGSIQIRV